MRGLTALLMLLALLLAGCTSDAPADTDGEDQTTGDGTNSDDNETTDPPTPTQETIEVSLTGAYPVNIAYDPATIAVTNNTELTIEFTNTDTGPSNHDWALEGHEDRATTATVGQDQTASVTFLVPEPGDYAFYCTVPGHRNNGMEGTFTVTT